MSMDISVPAAFHFEHRLYRSFTAVLFLRFTSAIAAALIPFCFQHSLSASWSISLTTSFSDRSKNASIQAHLPS